jgi:hypothetical protein
MGGGALSKFSARYMCAWALGGDGGCFVRTQCGGRGETVPCSGPIHGLTVYQPGL